MWEKWSLFSRQMENQQIMASQDKQTVKHDCCEQTESIWVTWHKNIQTSSDTFTHVTRLRSVSQDNLVQLLDWSNCFPFFFFFIWAHTDITLDCVNSMLFTVMEYILNAGTWLLFFEFYSYKIISFQDLTSSHKPMHIKDIKYLIHIK